MEKKITITSQLHLKVLNLFTYILYRYPHHTR